MARVRLCINCGNENRPTEVYCAHCAADLDGVSIEDTDQPRASNPDHVDEVVQDDPLAEFLSAGTPAGFSLAFPWGEVLVTDRLGIGRDDLFSPIAAQLMPFGTVSGIHAELWLDGAALRLRHLSQSNPTYINGVPHNDATVQTLQDGDTVAFSRQLVVRIKGPGK